MEETKFSSFSGAGPWPGEARVMILILETCDMIPSFPWIFLYQFIEGPHIKLYLELVFETLVNLISIMYQLKEMC